MASSPNYHHAEFLLSVADLKQLPKDEGVEVAFVGRSNAGKSSVLNQVTRNKSLARISKTPGRTQLINVFKLDELRRLIDLPGYGYAKVPPEMKQRWQALLDAYLRQRDCLYGLVLVMDIRHPLREFDQHMLAWATQCGLAVRVLLNKADKLKNGAARQTLREVTTALTQYGEQVSAQLFSAMKGMGIDELRHVLDHWFSHKVERALADE